MSQLASFVCFMNEYQVNSIVASERTVVRKKAKKDDFLPQLKILRDALAGNNCEGGAESKDKAKGGLVVISCTGRPKINVLIEQSHNQNYVLWG